jgi:hypothetical protein
MLSMGQAIDDHVRECSQDEPYRPLNPWDVLQSMCQ